MECRRRVGKRRMTGTADVASEPLSLQDFYDLWTFPQVRDTSKWQWSAPNARRQTESVPDSGLHSWLNTAGREEIPSSADNEEKAVSEIDHGPHICMHHFRIRCQAFAATNPSERHAIYTAFNADYSRDIALGLIPNRWIENTICSVIEHLRTAATDNRQFTILCCAFLKAFWSGITMSTVHHPHEMDFMLFKTVLELSATQIFEEDTQIMTVEILASLSSLQIEQLMPTILTLVQQWIQALHSDPATINMAKDHRDLTSSVSETALSRLIRLLDTLGKSVSRQVIKSVTDTVLASGSASSEVLIHEKRLRLFCWLSVVARAMSTTQNFLISNLIAAMSSGISINQSPSHPTVLLSLYDSCMILLDHWGVHNQLDSVDIIKSHFRHISVKEPGPASRALLVSILAKRKISWRKLMPIIRLVSACGPKDDLYDTLSAIEPGRIKTPPVDIGNQIQRLSYLDPKAALHVFKLFRHRRHEYKSLTIDHLGTFLANLIHAPTIHACEIWSIINLPLARLTRTHRDGALDPLRAKMVQRVGVEFGRAKQLSRRSALRNVMLCVIYLRKRRQVISPQLTRTLCHVGLKRDLDEQLSVGSSKMTWLLGLIEDAEGAAVADLVDRLIYVWRHKYPE